MREVVITGLGPVAPNGVGKENFWNALKEGKSGIRRITRFDPSGYPSQIAGEIPREWVEAVAPFPENGRAWSTHLIMTAAHLALQDAGLGPEALAYPRMGILMGISTTDMGIVEREYHHFQEHSTTTSSALFASFPHSAASELASAFNCAGEVVTLSAGCTGGLFSIIYGVEAILRGDVDMVLAGGGDAPLTPLLYAGFCASGLLSSNHKFGTASRPFDARRDGGILAEGAGVILLEEAERAYARGARVYARIAGWGISNSASPKQLQMSMAFSMAQALKKGGLQPSAVDYISAHAPSDKFIDKMETKAIKEVFGKHAYNLPVSSIKSMIGNPLAAAGPLQVIAAIQAMEYKFVPPTINYEIPDPSCDLDCVPNRGRVGRIKRALVNLHGLGGCNASLVISRD